MDTIKFRLVEVSCKLSCSKRILDECEKNVKKVLHCFSFEREMIQHDGDYIHLMVTTHGNIPDSIIEFCRSYCEGIRDGVFGILGSD